MIRMLVRQDHDADRIHFDTGHEKSLPDIASAIDHDRRVALQRQHCRGPFRRGEGRTGAKEV